MRKSFCSPDSRFTVEIVANVGVRDARRGTLTRPALRPTLTVRCGDKPGGLHKAKGGVWPSIDRLASLPLRGAGWLETRVCVVSRRTTVVPPVHCRCWETLCRLLRSEHFRTDGRQACRHPTRLRRMWHGFHLPSNSVVARVPTTCPACRSGVHLATAPCLFTACHWLRSNRM